jgi:hypothetical protein
MVTCSDPYILELGVTVSKHLADQGHNELQEDPFPHHNSP